MTNNTNPADAFLTGGGVPGAFGKDDPVGTTVSGTICEAPEVKQQTDLETGKPDTWDNGDPKMQLVVTIQADNIPVSDEDDGRRRFYVKGAKTAGTRSMRDAVATAVRSAKANGLEVGGRLTVQLVGTEPSKTRGFNDRKLWAAAYAPPPPGAASAGFLDTAPPLQAAPAPQPVYAPPVVAQPVYAPPVPQPVAQAPVVAPVPQAPVVAPVPQAPPVQQVPAPAAVTPNDAQLAAFAAWQATQQQAG